MQKEENVKELFMSTESIANNYKDLDTWPLEKSIAAIIESNQRAVDAVRQAIPQITKAAQGITPRLKAGGRLIYMGAGTSGRLAMQDAAELPPTFGFDNTLVLLAGGQEAGNKAQENAEDDTQAAIKEIEAAQVNQNDVLIGLAASGKTPYTVAGIKRARALGAFTIGITNNAGTPLLSESEVGILLVTGPEVLAGSTRLAAGTSQKIVLNALSTSVLVQLGGAYQNLMVGMRLSNSKLRQRAVNMVSLATGATEPQVQQALELSQGRIREAIVMLKKNIELEKAVALLAHHHNRVRDALE